MCELACGVGARLRCAGDEGLALRVGPVAHHTVVEGTGVPLSAGELDLLPALVVRHPGRVLSRTQLPCREVAS